MASHWMSGAGRRACVRGALFLALLASAPARSQPAVVEEAVQPAVGRAADRPGFYGRLGIGVDWPDAGRFRDDDCASINPPALFGCVIAEDGRRLGAYGDFQSTAVLDAAVGYRLNSWLRAEGLLSWRPDMAFSGQSNFLGADANQPVSASVSSVAGFGVLYADLPRIGGSVRPFLGAGLGMAHNRMGAMTYRFPSLSATASTTTPGGSRSDLAYLLTAGLSVPLSDRLDLDLAYRYTDLGQVQSESGQAIVVRSRGTRFIEIGGTRADLSSHGLMLSLRYAF